MVNEPVTGPMSKANIMSAVMRRMQVPQPLGTAHASSRYGMSDISLEAMLNAI